MNIIAISGALRKGSFNTALLHTVKARAPYAEAIEIVTLMAFRFMMAMRKIARACRRSSRRCRRKSAPADGDHDFDAGVQFLGTGRSEECDRLAVALGQSVQMEARGRHGCSEGPVGTARSQYHLRQNLVGLEAITMPKPEIFVRNSESKIANGKTYRRGDAEGRSTRGSRRSRSGSPSVPSSRRGP